MSVSFSTAPVSADYEPHPFGLGPKNFVLTDDALKNMAISANQTRKDGKERGQQYCIDPGLKPIGVTQKFDVLETASRCAGDECSVDLETLTSGCPPVEISWKFGKEVAEWLSPGQDYGNHHTHPGGENVPSPGDIFSALLPAVLYKKNKVMGCITGVTNTKGVEQDPPTNPEDVDPTLCWVIPKDKFPDIDTLMALLDNYDKGMKDIYAEWQQTGKQPDIDAKEWTKAKETFQLTEEFTDSIKAEVHFSGLDNMKKGKVRRQQTGIGDMPGYFDVKPVELQELQHNWTKGWNPFPKPKKSQRRK